MQGFLPDRPRPWARTFAAGYYGGTTGAGRPAREEAMRFALVAAAVVFGLVSAAGAAEYMEKTDFQKSRAFSPGVITQGGRIVWLAGQTATRDEAGNDISGNFEAQVRTIFSLMDKTLHKAGGSLANLVTMTVFINDPRNGDRFVEMRRDTFKDGNYPGSALITVSNFARPGMLIEIQGIAVIGDECSAAKPCSQR
jgi:2-iminobutanoate/2-iminopropanoate deaminase